MVVASGLRGRNVSDVGVAMYEHADIAQAGGLGVLVSLTTISLVLIHKFVDSRAITIFGVIWMLVWTSIYLAGSAFSF